MSTLVLQVAGAALGGLVGGPVGAVLGRAAGALAGSVVDQALFGTSKARVLEGPRLTGMEGLAATEGAPVPRVHGRVRVGGQLIWATRFEEQVNTTVRKAGGGKGLPSPRVKETTYSYFANLAVALCEGEISFVRRVWADGQELDLTPLTFRVHRGSADQLPDALIVAKEGAEHAPAYRGTAYVVFERLPLAPFGNRIPQLSFEVVRTRSPLTQSVRSVNLIPGSSEFACQPTAVSRDLGLGRSRPENRHQLQAGADLVASLDQLQALCPKLETVQIIASWFGNDLRAGECRIEPAVDAASKVTIGADWAVAGLTRSMARVVSQIDGRAAYGGAPSDASLVALIGHLKSRGLKVVLYPFISMDIAAGNGLPDPWGGPEQPAYPWRGRMTCHPAPGQPGSPDGTAAAAAQIDSFMGTVTAADVTIVNGAITCARPDDWGYRRFILHMARLASLAGGVDGFILGSEMVALTTVRGTGGSYPFPTALMALAADVRSIVGSATRLTYAADWTEYGAHVREGGSEVRFPLDPLWAHPAIDAVGIDFYPPLSDWRDGIDHADLVAGDWPDEAGFARGLRSGEAFAWFYADMAGRAAQQRLPITDGQGQPWLFRPKDLAGWWLNAHHERIGGVIQPGPTPWQPRSKPIWLTEFGVPAVDKGGNAPNVFPDPKSSEGGLPPFSDGARDDLAQARALVGVLGALDPMSALFVAEANPLAADGLTRMIDPADISLWAWDARPWPVFPSLSEIWADGANWNTGHWLNGRLEGLPLDVLIAAILADHGLPPARLAVDGFVDGYILDRPMSARAALEPLIRLFGLDARFENGVLSLSSRRPAMPVAIAAADLVPDRDSQPFRLVRAQESELPAELRLGFLDSAAEFARASALSRRLEAVARRQVDLEAPVVMPPAQAHRLADRALRAAWIGRETVSFALSPRRVDVQPGDLLQVEGLPAPSLVRIERITDGAVRQVEARMAARDLPPAAAVPDAAPVRSAPPLPGRPFVAAFDSPIVQSGVPTLQVMAGSAQPWPGSLAVLRGPPGGSLSALATLERPALIGRTLSDLPPGPLWRWDEAATVEVELAGGALQSIPDEAALAGGNLLVLQAPDGLCELVAVARADLIGPQRYRLSRLLRGLGQTEAAAARHLAAGATLIALDEALVPVASGADEIGQVWDYRIVPQGLDGADPMSASLTAAVGPLALQPLAPVHARARRIPEGVTLTWLRRTRVDGDGWEQLDVPLGEDIERYRVRLLDAAGLELRTAEVETPRWLYAAADELADFGASQRTITVEIAQISARVGPGQVIRQVVPVA